MRNLCKKMLNRIEYERINAKDAYDEIIKIKKERERVYNEELKKMEGDKGNDNKIYKKERIEYYAFIDAFNIKFNFYWFNFCV